VVILWDRRETQFYPDPLLIESVVQVSCSESLSKCSKLGVLQSRHLLTHNSKIEEAHPTGGPPGKPVSDPEKVFGFWLHVPPHRLPFPEFRDAHEWLAVIS